MALTSGWLYIDYGGTEFQVLCGDIEYDETDKGSTNIHYPGDDHFGFTIDTQVRKVKVSNVYINSIADWNTLKQNLKTLQSTGDVFNIRYKISSGTDWEKFDGTNEIMPVIIKSIRGKKKLSGGDTTVFTIKQIIFEQAGALTTA